MNQDQDQRVFRQFAAKKRRFQILTVLIGIYGITLVIAAGALADPAKGQLFGFSFAWVVWATAVLVALVLTVLGLRSWRCPACGKYMGGVVFMRYCPRCGVQLAP